MPSRCPPGTADWGNILLEVSILLLVTDCVRRHAEDESGSVRSRDDCEQFSRLLLMCEVSANALKLAKSALKWKALHDGVYDIVDSPQRA